MRRPALVLTLSTMLAVTAGLAAARSLTTTHPAADLELVAIEAGVGDVRVSGEDTDVVTVEVELKPRRGGLFSSMRTAEREVERAELVVDADGRRLGLKVDSGSRGDRRFEERWTVVVPAHLAAGLELGVGDVVVRGLAGGVEVELGVGDVDLRLEGGEVSVELGVGDATVRAPASSYAAVDSSSGVGDTLIQAPGERIGGSGLVGSSSRWEGPGSATLRVRIGVGDSRVTLD